VQEECHRPQYFNLSQEIDKVSRSGITKHLMVAFLPRISPSLFNPLSLKKITILTYQKKMGRPQSLSFAESLNRI
jgi:hypothetical protein